jgi:hypothetical protein
MIVPLNLTEKKKISGKCPFLGNCASIVPLGVEVYKKVQGELMTR